MAELKLESAFLLDEAFESARMDCLTLRRLVSRVSQRPERSRRSRTFPRLLALSTKRSSSTVSQCLALPTLKTRWRRWNGSVSRACVQQGRRRASKLRAPSA